MKKPWEWEREDLENLIGQMEHTRLEFKSSQIFSGNDEKIAIDLSKEVSAFANSEGGVLVIGIEESKGKGNRKAVSVGTGVEIEVWTPERVQSKIEGNISPHLTGIRVKPIFLDSEHTKCAYVIDVPQGTTAYQAKDHRYYGRSEYQIKPLPDHEIRLRMFRGKSPSASIMVNNFYRVIVYQQEIEIRGHRSGVLPDFDYGDGEKSLEEKKPPTEEKKPRKINGYSHGFNVLMENLGEINITQFKAEFSFSGSSEILALPAPYSSSFKDGWTEITSHPAGSFDAQYISSSTRLNVYPGDKLHLERRSFTMPTQDILGYRLVMHWKLYLQDTFPISGEVSIIDSFRGVCLSGEDF